MQGEAPHMTKECKHCGAAFSSRGTKPSAFAARVYCSRSCAATASNIASADHSEEALWKRFWAKVDKSPGLGPQGECWEWQARVDGRGYGEIKVAGQYRKAHRIALFGPTGLSNPLFACHHCDNPRCVRPNHLFAGTSLDNVHDMHAKGRAVRRSKINEQDVAAIRASAEKRSALAARFGLHPLTISKIKSGAYRGGACAA